MPTGTALPVWKRLLFGAVVLLGIPFICVALIEGVSSLVLLQRDLSQVSVDELPERRHTAYDTLLGWMARPDFYDPNLYGPNISLRTNAQGFRNDHPIAPRVAPGRIRAVCSGDSYTLGWGVDDEHSWCRLLEQRIPGLESVNMGQGGYGVDQAYLWYKRDGQPLEHQLHIFGVILEDIERMRYPAFSGFGKPVLRVEGDSIRVDNVPVPRGSYRWPRVVEFLYSARPAFGSLRMSMLWARISARVRRMSTPAPRARHKADGTSPRNDSVADPEWPVVERVFRNLAVLNRARGSRLVVVFLPIRKDWNDSKSDAWRRALAAAAPRDGYTFVDLVPEFRQIPDASLDQYFLQPGDPYAHYNTRGHEWAADHVVRHLRASPGLEAVFDSAAAHSAATAAPQPR